jgi:hypothetical protein
MKRSGSALEFSRMNRPSLIILALVSIGLVLTGCQGSVLTAKGHKIDPSQQIVINQGGQQSGQYSSADLSINYTYTKTGDTLQISGVVQFNASITDNYNTVNYFELGLVVADAQGMVLKQHGMTTAETNSPSTPISFNVSLSLPAQSQFMAFSYTGQVSGVRTGPVSIWRYPVNEL